MDKPANSFGSVHRKVANNFGSVHRKVANNFGSVHRKVASNFGSVHRKVAKDRTDYVIQNTFILQTPGNVLPPKSTVQKMAKSKL